PPPRVGAPTRAAAPEQEQTGSSNPQLRRWPPYVGPRPCPTSTPIGRGVGRVNVMAITVPRRRPSFRDRAGSPYRTSVPMAQGMPHAATLQHLPTARRPPHGPCRRPPTAPPTPPSRSPSPPLTAHL